MSNINGALLDDGLQAVMGRSEMSNEENKRIVAEGLERRKAEREAAAQEARLDSYEQEQMDAVHQNCVDARLSREAEENRERENRERERRQRVERRRAWAAEAARKQQLEDKSTAAVRYYGVLCLVVLLVSAMTKLPFWAAMALILGGMVFPAVYIFRLYYPMED